MPLDLDTHKDAQEPSKKAGKTTAPVAAPTPREEPGWFQPGSRSEALVRGFSQGATLGMAPKFSAYGQDVLSRLMPDTFGTQRPQAEILKEYLDANRAAQAAQPGYSLAGNIVGSAPSMIAAGAGSLPMQITKGAGLSALDTLGSSEKTGMDLAKDVASGGAVGGAATAALPLVGKVAKMAGNVARGVPDVERIGEAAIKFKNAPLPPTKGLEGTGAAYRARQALKSFDEGIGAAEGDTLIRSNPMALDRDTLAAVIKNANVQAPSVFKEIIPETLKQAGAGAALGYGLSGGDVDKALAGAAAGAGSGAYTGAGRAMSGAGAKLRLPGASSYEGLPQALAPLNMALAQSASRDFKEPAGISTSPFGRLTDYISQAKDSSNPAVTAAAAAADAQVDPSDEDSRRRAAMNLQSTPAGRAVGNTTSSYRDLDQEAD